MNAPKPRPRRRRLRDLRSVPVLPSLITLGNLFLGFLAMAKAADAVRLGNIDEPAVVALFETATLCIFLAMVFDALDGRVARMTGQTSAFGAQLDSLADVVTFGCAPAFVALQLVKLHELVPGAQLPPHPKIYYVCAAVYVLCAAMRLARFNVESHTPTLTDDDHSEFRGLPSPGAAAVIGAMLAFFCASQDAGAQITQWLVPDDAHFIAVRALPAVLVLAGLLMVSRVPFPHFFQALVARRHSFPFLAGLVVLIGLVLLEWQLGLLLSVVAYLVWGLARGVLRVFTKDDDGPSDDGEAQDAAPAPGSVGRLGTPDVRNSGIRN
ncbi:MAG: phosphatidylcholine/phosphatidylserine synthase [Planctomycetes bacterium]|nr:phosphatidylcholine/phosphatidylserine synthase [Planctomycetota bacterium]